MENGDSFLHALEDFEKRKEMTPELEQYLQHIAKTGETIYPWNRLKPVFLLKLEKVMQEFNEEAPKVDGPPTPNVENLSYEEMRERVVSIIESFTGPPFTMQRLCELVTDPKKHYKRSDKFLRGVEKNVLVVSTVHGGASRRLSAGGDKLVNGIASQDGAADGLSVAMPPPPCPAPHLTPIAAGASPLPPFPPPDHDHLETPSLGASPSVCNDISDTSPSSPAADHTGTNGGESHRQSGETTVDKGDDSLRNSTYTEQLEDRSRIADDIGGEDSAPSDSSTSEDSSESSLSDDTPTSAPDGNPTETGSSAETSFSTEPCQSTEPASSSAETMFPAETTEAAPSAEAAEPRDTTDSSAASSDVTTTPEDKGSETEPYTRPTRACTRSADVLEEEQDDSGSPRKIRRIEEPQPSDQSEQTTASHDQAAPNQPEPSSEQETPASQSEESSEEQKAEDVEEPMEQD
ncbi:serine/threonine-protein phosphatase 4 regulatory subunit 2-B-like isoform X1 [Branchiostoma lanceolatum]|uniref:serine/threonine-protein phosphatase 4 regulatory subunit 2-B-like isoform X1 n=1 Tax=Branchiostoma lanceolatum TaxID=7740 RepID=UPI0034530CDA